MDRKTPDMQSSTRKNSAMPVLHALLAAVLFGMNAPFSKLLTQKIDPLYLAALLYLGAGFGMLLLTAVAGRGKRAVSEARLERKDLRVVVWMIVLDIAAPVFLMFGLKLTNAATASLLGNFEIVATSVIALVVFREAIGRRMWLAIALVSVSCMLLTVEDPGRLKLSAGALLVLLSCLCWGFENNCTRCLSLKDPKQIVVVKGLGSGFGALVIAVAAGRPSLTPGPVALALLLGFFAYGLSIAFYVMAQRQLGAARTSAYYAAAPFVGILLSWLVLREPITPSFVAALAIMLAGTWLAASEDHGHEHLHEALVHEHRHTHDDGHHNHAHDADAPPGEPHSHLHRHEPVTHRHAHHPDLHHLHRHSD